jgi:hypothetical protein
MIEGLGPTSCVLGIFVIPCRTSRCACRAPVRADDGRAPEGKQNAIGNQRGSSLGLRRARPLAGVSRAVLRRVTMKERLPRAPSGLRRAYGPPW